MKTIAHPNPGRNLQVDIPPPLKQELKVIAAQTGRDLRDVVVEGLERGLPGIKRELEAQSSNGAVDKPTTNGSSTRRKK
jgi:fructose-1,6-bisphosphatase/sedoheptulose 1,7-bisphosphatase-like protein